MLFAPTLADRAILPTGWEGRYFFNRIDRGLIAHAGLQVIRCELTLHPTQLLALVEEALTSMPGEPEDVQEVLGRDVIFKIERVEQALLSSR
ncbi:hypothetical protein N619_01885 [Ectopseudomonas oleovorans]|nr:hypothetical protein N619_01885 [Pseudomonas oleovorans]